MTVDIVMNVLFWAFIFVFVVLLPFAAVAVGIPERKGLPPYLMCPHQRGEIKCDHANKDDK